MCSNGIYYTASTKHLEKRIQQHNSGEGVNYTKKHRPIVLIYYEEFHWNDYAFLREKQVQKWSRKKKEALINGDSNLISQHAKKIFSKNTAL